nr:hypothetical protein [Tanacetum cinerariifolium]
MVKEGITDLLKVIIKTALVDGSSIGLVDREEGDLGPVYGFQWRHFGARSQVDGTSTLSHVCTGFLGTYNLLDFNSPTVNALERLASTILRVVIAHSGSDVYVVFLTNFCSWFFTFYSAGYSKAILEKHLKTMRGKVLTHFPPEPNGFLHIGHAKRMLLRFQPIALAKRVVEGEEGSDLAIPYQGHTLAKEFILRGPQTIVFTNSTVFLMISRVNIAYVVIVNGGTIAPVGLKMVALATQRHKPDTPHEMWFHNEYMGHIKAPDSKSSIFLGEVLLNNCSDKKELAIPVQTETGKELSNPLMAGSLPKTTLPTNIHLPLLVESYCCSEYTYHYQLKVNAARPKLTTARVYAAETSKLITEVVTTVGVDVNAASVQDTPITATEATKVIVPRKRRGVIIQDREETTTTVTVQPKVQAKDKGKTILIEEPKPLERQVQIDLDEERKPLTEAQARRNMTVYLKNMAGYKMKYFKWMSYDEIRSIFKKHFNYNQAFLNEVNERIKVPEKEVSQEKEVEVKSSKREDDTLLASKILIVDHKIHTARNRPYFKIIRADGNHRLFLSFGTMLKNFDREDLESLWKIVRERFEKTEPKNYTDDFLLNTLKIMFEKPNVEANIFLLVEKMYPLTHFTLEQMVNEVRLKVKDESEMSLELLRLVRRQLNEGNGPISVITDTNRMIKVLPPKTAKEVMAKERERKARTTLLMALPEDHLVKFHKMADAKEMWFQTLLSQLEIHGAGVSHKDANQKFLRSLPSSWSQVALIMRTKPGLDTLSFDDLYNNIRVFEHDVKGTTASSSNIQNVAFVSAENTSSTNDVSTAYSVSSPSVSKSQKERSSSYTDEINDNDIEEMELKWQVAMISMRIKKFHKRTGRKLQFDTKDPVGFDKTKVECFNCHKWGILLETVGLKGTKTAEGEMLGTMETKLETMVGDPHIR